MNCPLDYKVGPGYVREQYGEPYTVTVDGQEVSALDIVYNAPAEASEVQMVANLDKFDLEYEQYRKAWLRKWLIISWLLLALIVGWSAA